MFVLVEMKEHNHLEKLAEVLSALKAILSDFPVLIIDDEANQVSLDNHAYHAEKDATTNHRHLLSIRKVLKRFNAVQYTATPQANLVIKLSDEFSARHCTIDSVLVTLVEMHFPKELTFRKS